MVVISGCNNGIGMRIRKRLGKPGSPDPKGLFGIYRVRHRWGKVIQEKLPFYTPTNPQTVPQQANRQKLTNAVTAWQALTPTQKAVYNKNAIGKEMSGYNLFLSEYLYSH